ncbi:class I SAM-dependent methyltransferase [Jannaschia formosa]|uniref:class I SAM-dependent methyltransferase n=1 Tax=Jannaschia formosa TaxID=2259592 RepID=UPI000E1C1748|nr:class I SAM-dependent methyltransferase [Jannaschia formosa]TFL16345.1 class I SAM-dependent methyltransferase [Jannaschia formosa]
MPLPRALYDGLLAEVYDDYTDADNRDDLVLWHRLCGEGHGVKLELASGTGRILLPLLAEEYPVEGLDNSADMLARCRDRGTEMGLAPVLHEADMTTFTLGRRYGLIFCAAGSLTLLAEPGQMEAALERSREHLEPGGQLALAMDAPAKPATGKVLARDMRRDGDGARLRCILDPLPDANPEVARWRMTNEVVPPDGATRRETADIAFRRPAPHTFADMLRARGFADVTLMDAHGTGPIRAGEEAYLALARAG